MAEELDVDAVKAALDRLHWNVRDLFIACLQYGNIGTEADLRRHLAMGDHATPAQHAVIVAALNDGLLEQDDPFRV